MDAEFHGGRDVELVAFQVPTATNFVRLRRVKASE
jgi:hypothetical protein